jgi:hypothetical protein
VNQVSITVDFDLVRCSPNRHQCWQVKAQHASAARTAARIAWMQAGEPTLTPPVRVNVIVRRPRPLDQDNAWASAKHLIDGICGSPQRKLPGIVPDDRPRYVRLGELTQITGKAAGGPSVTFEIVSEAEDET